MLLGRYSLVVVFVALMLIMAAQVPTVAAPSRFDSFDHTWERADQPVAERQTSRSWMWGSHPFTPPIQEPYIESPDGRRTVQYFDKSRMELTNPEVGNGSPWYVTNGLLVTELITGRVQLGRRAFEQRHPAQVNIAGDADDPTGPTYASLEKLLDTPPKSTGGVLIERVDRNGQTVDDGRLGVYNITASQIDPETNHAIADPFWAFMTMAGPVSVDGRTEVAPLVENVYYATGRPITEAYWASVQVAGEVQDVLLQCFERRCLTYTPGNDPAWQVEAGNVGRHYHAWRYGNGPTTGQLTVHYINVGEADATLLQAPNMTILIDAGDYEHDNVVRDVVPYLRSVGITRIDLLIGTHPHLAHIGQFPRILDVFDVAEVWMSGDRHSSGAFSESMKALNASDANYYEPRAGDTFTYGPLEIEVINPAELTGDLHEGSISLRASYGNVQFMFTGDAPGETELATIDRGHNLNAQILKVGNHGSTVSSEAEFLDVVRPEVAIYSSGEGNRYGHPDPEVIKEFEERGIAVYGTDIDGTVRVVTDGETYTVHFEGEGTASNLVMPVLHRRDMEQVLTR